MRPGHLARATRPRTCGSAGAIDVFLRPRPRRRGRPRRARAGSDRRAAEPDYGRDRMDGRRSRPRWPSTRSTRSSPPRSRSSTRWRSLCERVGADAHEVERALKSEARIGPRAYLGPGAAVSRAARSPATCARSPRSATPKRCATPLLHGHLAEQLRSPRAGHGGRWKRCWKRSPRTVVARVGPDLQAGHGHAAQVLVGRALPRARRRRSASSAHTIRPSPSFPASVEGIELVGGSAGAPCDGADALVIATEWPEYRAVEPERDRRGAPRRPCRWIANGFLAGGLADRAGGSAMPAVGRRP